MAHKNVLIKFSESHGIETRDRQTLNDVSDRIQTFIGNVIHHNNLAINQTASNCLEEAAKATTISINLQYNGNFECCFSHKRKENAEVTFRRVATLSSSNIQLITTTFIARHRYVNLLQALVFLSNWKSYLNHSPLLIRKKVNSTALYIARFVHKVNRLD